MCVEAALEVVCKKKKRKKRKRKVFSARCDRGAALGQFSDQEENVRV